MENSVPPWPRHPATIVAGHRVASGANRNPRFPGGTLRMQAPHFRRRGLDIDRFHRGTLNVTIAPRKPVPVRPRMTFPDVRWHPTEPAEDFSFCDAAVRTAVGQEFTGLVYYPHPETKPEHFQDEHVLELLMPEIPGIEYGQEIELAIDPAQMALV